MTSPPTPRRRTLMPSQTRAPRTTASPARYTTNDSRVRMRTTLAVEVRADPPQQRDQLLQFVRGEALEQLLGDPAEDRRQLRHQGPALLGDLDDHGAAVVGMAGAPDQALA